MTKWIYVAHYRKTCDALFVSLTTQAKKRLKVFRDRIPHWQTIHREIRPGKI